jgi:hypothetical protein
VTLRLHPVSQNPVEVVIGGRRKKNESGGSLVGEAGGGADSPMTYVDDLRVSS